MGIEGSAPLGGVNLFGNIPCLDHLLGPGLVLSEIDDVEVQLGGRGFFPPTPGTPKDPLTDPPPPVPLPLPESLPKLRSSEGRVPLVERLP